MCTIQGKQLIWAKQEARSSDAPVDEPRRAAVVSGSQATSISDVVRKAAASSQNTCCHFSLQNTRKTRPCPVPAELQRLPLPQPLPCPSLFLRSQRNKPAVCHFIRSQCFSSPPPGPVGTPSRGAPKERHRSTSEGRGEWRQLIWAGQLCSLVKFVFQPQTSRRALAWKRCRTPQRSGPGRCSRSPRP